MTPDTQSAKSLQAQTEALHEFVIKGLQRLKGTAGKDGGWREVEAETDVPFTTIRNIVHRRVANPRLKNLEKLAGYIRANSKRRA